MSTAEHLQHLLEIISSHWLRQALPPLQVAMQVAMRVRVDQKGLGASVHQLLHWGHPVQVVGEDRSYLHQLLSGVYTTAHPLSVPSVPAGEHAILAASKIDSVAAYGQLLVFVGVHIKIT